jgi:hypothetical protein
MFSPPIRPIQSSSEVRRVDEVTAVKHVVERAPSSVARYEESVRITIGADARRLAGSTERPGAEEADEGREHARANPRSSASSPARHRHRPR